MISMNADTRRGPYASSATLRRGTIQRVRRPKPTTSRPWPWPKHSACARSVAHCHRGLGMLYAAIGQREQARTALSTALDLYHTMDMTFWLPQAEAALAQGDG